MRRHPSSTRLASSHLRPRRSGSDNDLVGPGPGPGPASAPPCIITHPVETTSTLTLASTSTSAPTSVSVLSHTSASAHTAPTTLTGQQDDGDALISTYDADEEDEYEDGLVDHEDPDQGPQDSETWYYSTTQHLHHHPPHQPHLLPQSTHLPSLDDLDEYMSDDLETSDDAGAPLVDYADVFNLLTDGMDSEPDMTSDPEPGEGAELGYADPDEQEDDDSEGSAVEPNYPFLSSYPEHVMSNPLVSVTGGILTILSQPASESPTSTPFPMPSHSAQEADMAAASEWLESNHPAALSNPNPAMLGPGNYCLTDFLHRWARQSRTVQTMTRERGHFPWPNKINELASKEVTRIKYDDLDGELYDMQGINWEDIGVTRREARACRRQTYNNYVNNEGSDQWTPDLPDISIPRSESYFRFRRMDIRKGINLAHFQLRNILATISRTRAFYPGHGLVHQFNPISTASCNIMNLGDAPGSQVSTLAAGHGVLVAGVFNGEYILRHVDSDEPESMACHEGVITSDNSGITNHAQVYLSRDSSTPRVAFASNDKSFRVLDVATETWLSSEKFEDPLNCTAVSPDGRLRVMVGDSQNVLITAAESTLPGNKPEILQELSGHRDFGFACDWSDDGWSVATGCQDKSIKIWDARRWTDSSGNPYPVCTLRAEMAGVRNLRFSPAGSGKSVLVAAEEADFVNIIDAQTFRSKQTVDIFGEIGGISFTNEGRELMVLCCDRDRGGLLQLERCGFDEGGSWPMDEEIIPRSRHHGGRQGGARYVENMSSSPFEPNIRSILRGRRKAAAQDMLEPF